MRRRDREVTDINEILNIINGAGVLHLGLVDEGRPYVIPMNYGFSYEDGKMTFYVHGSLEGRKIDIVKAGGEAGVPATVEIENDVQLFSGKVACQYGCSYRCFMGFGQAHLITEPEEKMHALSVLMKTLTGEDFEFNERLVSVVSVIRIDIDTYSAKYRPLPPVDLSVKKE